MLYLKIINTIWKNDTCILYETPWSEELKNGMKILLSQAILKVMDENKQNVALVNYSITAEIWWYLNSLYNLL